MFRNMCHSSAGAVKAAGKRPYEKWSDAEEDTFFLALKATAGCLPNVVCTAAAKRIGTKDYIQVMMRWVSRAPRQLCKTCQSCGVKLCRAGSADEQAHTWSCATCYVQVRAYYGRVIKRLDSALTASAQMSVHEVRSGIQLYCAHESAFPR
jgi:hypothetical protein